MKKCKKCGEEKSLNEFRKNGKYVRHVCKYCEKFQERQRKRIKVDKIRQALNDKKVELGCCICSWNQFPFALDLHHIDPDEKSFAVSVMLRSDGNSVTYKRLQNEIEKCCVVCSNCHRGLHAGIIPEPQSPVNIKLSESLFQTKGT